MSRSSFVEKVKACCGPIGPLQTIDESERRQSEFARQLSDQEIEWLIELQIRPPERSELDIWEQEHFSVVVLELLAEVGRVDPDAFVRRLSPYLRLNPGRMAIFELIGWLGDERGLPLLASMLDEGALSDDELLALADAAQEIGGAAAKSIISRVAQCPHLNSIAWAQKLRAVVDKEARGEFI